MFPAAGFRQREPGSPTGRSSEGRYSSSSASADNTVWHLNMGKSALFMDSFARLQGGIIRCVAHRVLEIKTVSTLFFFVLYLQH